MNCHFETGDGFAIHLMEIARCANARELKTANAVMHGFAGTIPNIDALLAVADSNLAKMNLSNNPNKPYFSSLNLIAFLLCFIHRPLNNF
jgi:hypothetical protein